MQIACTVQRCINYRQIGIFAHIGIDLRFADFAVEILEHLALDILDCAIFKCFVKVHGFCACEHIHLLYIGVGLCRRFVRHLVTVRVIAFVAVVFGRIVACGNDNARTARERSHRVRKHRRRHQFGIQIHLHTVRRQNACGRARKYIRFDAGIVGNRNRGILKIRIQIIRQPLRCLIDGINIHAVRTRTDNAAQARRTEFQILIKTV